MKRTLAYVLAALFIGATTVYFGTLPVEAANATYDSSTAKFGGKEYAMHSSQFHLGTGTVSFTGIALSWSFTVNGGSATFTVNGSTPTTAFDGQEFKDVFHAAIRDLTISLDFLEAPATAQIFITGARD